MGKTIKLNSRSTIAKECRAMEIGDRLKILYKDFNRNVITARVSDVRREGERDFEVDTRGNTYGYVTRIK